MSALDLIELSKNYKNKKTEVLILIPGKKDVNFLMCLLSHKIIPSPTPQIKLNLEARNVQKTEIFIDFPGKNCSSSQSLPKFIEFRQKKCQNFHYLLTYPPNSVKNIGRPQRSSIVHDCWRQLSIRQKTFSHFISRQCASRWLWGLLISFLVGSILKRYGKFHFDFFVKCVQSNQISSFQSLYLCLTVQFFHTVLGW